MQTDNHNLIYTTLLEMKEDFGSMKADIAIVKEHLRIINGSVAKHSTFINNWKGKMSVVVVILSVGVSLVVDFIKGKI